MKTALFAFNGDSVCFIHVLVNALDMDERGGEVRIIIEGSATALLNDFAEARGIGQNHFQSCLEKGLIASACLACSNKTGGSRGAEKLGIPLDGEIHGHPSMQSWRDKGFDIITF
jgi:hypothetical protein